MPFVSKCVYILLHDKHFTINSKWHTVFLVKLNVCDTSGIKKFQKMFTDESLEKKTTFKNMFPYGKN